MGKYKPNLMKKRIGLSVLLTLIMLSSAAQDNVEVEFLAKFKLANTSVRAIEVINKNTLWFAGSGGKYGRIINDRLEIDSISHEGKYPQFRSIGFNGTFLFLLSIENPALIYKIDPSAPLGQYELVYQEVHEKVFYDSLAFFDDKNGIAMGDPTEDCLSVLLTHDGGNSWAKIPCKKLPKIFEGEAAFAASNTNIAIFEKNAWIATGGAKARVFKTTNYGKKWNVVETPIVQGGKMTGIFTTDFYDSQTGIIMGGDWENKKSGKSSKAVTSNGGKTWNLVADEQLPGYISCVQFIPNGNGKNIMAVSTEGIFISNDTAKTWKKIEEKGYYSLRFINEKTAWLSTNEEIVKIKLQ